MNKKIHKILACVDFSDYSPSVLEYAAALVKDSQVLVYNVINQNEAYSIGTASLYAPSPTLVQEDIKDMEKERTKRLHELITEHSPEAAPRMNIKIDVGMPSEQILKTIDAEGIDLVILANKGRGNISRFLFGSTAEKVFRHSPVPVVSVRDRKKFKRD
ncbi:MAG: universal stress protein [Proteobacteria bacterium]|nr:universal stress protein [Desulfobacula sp.]MBU4132178.1 universal stress protein [Pseudomonadota bacterium]